MMTRWSLRGVTLCTETEASKAKTLGPWAHSPMGPTPHLHIDIGGTRGERKVPAPHACC